MLRSFTINRETWLTAEVAAKLVVSSLLLNNHHSEHKGLMCCLGTICSQAGVPVISLEDHSTPAVLSVSLSKVPDFLVDTEGENSKLTHAAMSINDSVDLSRKTREIALFNLFYSHGIYIAFEGEYPSWLGEETRLL